VKRLIAAFVVAAVIAPCHVAAQGSNAGNGVRFGLSFGGTSTVALDVEFYRDGRSLDLALGTWSFRALSFSAVAKQYFGGRAARPVVGLGLWIVGARTASTGERTGVALVLRAPVGLDWEFADQHAVGPFINLNRGLWVRRSNPDDDAPMVKRLVPLPQLYYRYRR